MTHGKNLQTSMALMMTILINILEVDEVLYN